MYWMGGLPSLDIDIDSVSNIIMPGYPPSSSSTTYDTYNARRTLEHEIHRRLQFVGDGPSLHHEPEVLLAAGVL